MQKSFFLLLVSWTFCRIHLKVLEFGVLISLNSPQSRQRLTERQRVAQKQECETSWWRATYFYFSTEVKLGKRKMLYKTSSSGVSPDTCAFVSWLLKGLLFHHKYSAASVALQTLSFWCFESTRLWLMLFLSNIISRHFFQRRKKKKATFGELFLPKLPPSPSASWVVEK